VVEVTWPYGRRLNGKRCRGGFPVTGFPARAQFRSQRVAWPLRLVIQKRAGGGGLGRLPWASPYGPLRRTGSPSAMRQQYLHRNHQQLGFARTSVSNLMPGPDAAIIPRQIQAATDQIFFRRGDRIPITRGRSGPGPSGICESRSIWPRVWPTQLPQWCR